MKTCIRCKQTKDLWAFHNSKKYKDGKKSLCSDCYADDQKVYRARMREKAGKKPGRHIDPWQKVREGTKPCKVCKRKLSVESFYTESGVRTGLSSDCKECRRERARRRLKDPEVRARVQQYQREWNWDKRREAGKPLRSSKTKCVRVDVAPLREAVQKYLEHNPDESFTTVALRAGMAHRKDGKLRGESSGLQVSLGLKAQSSRKFSRRENKMISYTYTNTTIDDEKAKRICSAIDLAPVDVGF